MKNVIEELIKKQEVQRKVIDELIDATIENEADVDSVDLDKCYAVRRFISSFIMDLRGVLKYRE